MPPPASYTPTLEAFTNAPPPSRITAFFDALSPASCPRVKTLSFEVPPPTLRVECLIASLPKIGLLVTPPSTLLELLHLSDSDLAQCFPYLEKLTLTACPEPTDALALKAFLAARVARPSETATKRKRPPSRHLPSL
ncbi:hypothetical protein GALMADRAFT_145825 [Galerina marginata CBS 339.88]|uniref:Uncharacterized protein n=1 Tax=Galerina marginata (strain CBS 339.88) TaxID=685588 RepID=A0A067SDX6_GALM3|nr:hypothetical protein GALMADRAFT_145825 [Galerina marginata CBS 339.88]